MEAIPPGAFSTGFFRPLKNAKYEHFAQLVAKGESVAIAYVLTGYGEKGAAQSGNRLLRRPEVAARVAQLKLAIAERRTEKAAVDVAWVVAQAVEVYQRAMQPQTILDQEGNVVSYTFQARAAIQALNLLAKHLGMFDKPGKDTGVAITEMIIERLHEGRERNAAAKRQRNAEEQARRESLAVTNQLPAEPVAGGTTVPNPQANGGTIVSKPNDGTIARESASQRRD